MEALDDIIEDIKDANEEDTFEKCIYCGSANIMVKKSPDYCPILRIQEACIIITCYDCNNTFHGH